MTVKYQFNSNWRIDYLTSLAVHEWLVYIPIFVDFSQIDPFISWMKKETKGLKVFEGALEKIKEVQSDAWISPDFTTNIVSIKGRIYGFDTEIRIEFRLRTLCLQIRCWNKIKGKIHVLDAFDEMKKAEDEFKNITERWGTIASTCNILVVKPFYASPDTARNWLMDHLEDLEFFPINCDMGCSFTLSLSKLIEEDEKLPFLVTSIRDSVGLQRKLILICCEKADDRPDGPCSYQRVRWVFFSSLIHHVLSRINKRASLIAEEISRIEEEVIKKSREPFKSNDTQSLMRLLQRVSEYSKQLSSLKNEISLLSDDLAGVESNLILLEVTAGPEGITKQPVVDEKICGNVGWITGGEFGPSYGILGNTEVVALAREVPSPRVKCKFGYYCALCDSKNGLPDLAKEPPLKMGVTEETKSLIEYSKKEFGRKKQEIIRSMNRTKSFVSDILSVLSTQVNLSLDLSLSQTAVDQKEILSEVETILEQAERDRKVAESATKAVEILSLLFASFVLGEISSNFIIWWLQQIWPTQAPWFAFLGGFFLALGIASMIFLPIYLGYLKKKWAKTSSNKK